MKKPRDLKDIYENTKPDPVTDTLERFKRVPVKRQPVDKKDENKGREK